MTFAQRGAEELGVYGWRGLELQSRSARRAATSGPWLEVVEQVRTDAITHEVELRHAARDRVFERRVDRVEREERAFPGLAVRHGFIS